MGSSIRIESDFLGQIEVPENRYWGAETQRSFENFSIGEVRMPMSVIRALATIKRSAAIVNRRLGILPEAKCRAIIQASDEIITGKLDLEFPLTVWQTGSGTQTHMNVNEVIANRAIEILGGKKGSKDLVHPNDDVNRNQSTNDVFPTAMHMAAVDEIEKILIPMLFEFHETLLKKEKIFSGIIKIGRTHLMDATPLTLGQEFSGYRTQVELGIERMRQTLERLRMVALGGTAVGTGLNAPKGFADETILEINALTQGQYYSATNKFEALASHDALVFAHGALKTVACSFLKIADDIRWMGSGPRCGLHELKLPENEAGSSIMPGKVNPTQCEALMMVCCQVFGNDLALSMGGANGNFELNAFKPLIIYNFLNSVQLLSQAGRSFEKNCLRGIEAHPLTHVSNVKNSLMLVTALSPHLGYEKAAKIAQLADTEGITLKAAGLKLGFLNEQQFDQWVQPTEMLSSNSEH